MFKQDLSGIKPSQGGYKILPAGTYTLKIVDTQEGRTRDANFPMVTVHYKVAEGEYEGENVKYHNVVFQGKDRDGKPRPGAGIGVHYLKTIGEPWEGSPTIDHMRWRGRLLKAKIEESEYNGKPKNEIKAVEPIEGKQPEIEESVPF